MATTYVEYNARISKCYEDECWLILMFLREQKALHEKGDFFVFRVVDGDDYYGFRLGKIDHHLPEHNKEASTLQKLIERNRVELTEVKAFCSSWGFNDDKPCNPVELADSIPTLILQEVLARRLQE